MLRDILSRGLRESRNKAAANELIDADLAETAEVE
jgi:hypothetical protein